MITCILLALIYVQNSITMPHLVVIRLMCVIKWLRSDSDGSCVNKKGRGYKGFYSTSSEQYRIRYLGHGHAIYERMIEMKCDILHLCETNYVFIEKTSD